MPECPSCLNKSFEKLIDFGIAPKSGICLSNPQEKFNSLRVYFEFCTNCALIRRIPFEKEPGNYSNIERVTGNQLPKYTPLIIDSLDKKTDNFIIEVGSNDGTFLDCLKNAGFKNLLGIEPSIECSKRCKSKGHRTENVHFNNNESLRIKNLYGSADIIICRQTIEHVPNPLDFLESIGHLLKNEGTFFLEVPDSYGIIYRNYGYELWERHVHYFSEKNLEILVKRTGFKVNRKLVLQHLQGKNILMWANKSNKIDDVYHDFTQDISSCSYFEINWRNFSAKFAKEIKKLKKPIAGIGASHPQSNFFMFTNTGEHLSYLIDDNPDKKNLYMPLPQPVKIIPTSELPEDISIVRTAFGYNSWMDKICARINSQRIIDPYAY